MSGRGASNTLSKGIPPEGGRRPDRKKAELRAAMPLFELRRARAMTQKRLGEMLGVNQPAIAKMEHRADMYVANLRSFIEAMGGRLRIVAEFPEGEVTITNFSTAGDAESNADAR